MAANTNPRRKNSARRNKVRDWLKRQGRPCWICGLGIDYGLPPGNPLSFECDELIPISQGGSPYQRTNVGAAHRCCNNWRKNKSVSKVQMIAAKVKANGYQSPLEFVDKAKIIEKRGEVGEHHTYIKTSTQW